MHGSRNFGVTCTWAGVTGMAYEKLDADHRSVAYTPDCPEKVYADPHDPAPVPGAATQLEES